MAEELAPGSYKIEDICKKDLILNIPLYQRGYRWTKSQIEKLLDDLSSFEGEEYTLQPIALKMERPNTYRVIDGQQRLTTIALILNACYNDTSLINKIKPKGKENWAGLDQQFITNAQEIIHDWQASHQSALDTLKKKLQKAAMLVYILEDVQPSASSSHEITRQETEFFSKINSGKIPLTNSEIIKALFVKILSDTQEKRTLLRQWEDIENDLQDDNLWLFISNNTKKADTRIDLLFELLKKSHEEIQKIKETKNSSYNLFLVYEDYLKQGNPETKVKNIWQEIQRYYSTLKYVYSNRALYHPFGYLMATDEKLAKICLKDLYKADKQAAEALIKAKIKAHVKNLVSDAKTPQLTQEELNLIKNFDFEKSKEKIKDILLLFNIITAIDMEGFRFPFAVYKKAEYDVEHIHARNTNLPTADKNCLKDWLETTNDEDIGPFITAYPHINPEKLKEEKQKFIKNPGNANNSTEALKSFALYGYLKEFIDNNDNNNPNEDTLQKFINCQKISDKEKYINDCAKETDVNDFGNLTLLNASINRSYGNDYFAQKQQTILKEDLKGTFILPCTKRIFLGHYTACEKIWNKTNKEEYIKTLIDTITNFVLKEEYIKKLIDTITNLVLEAKQNG